MRKMSYVYENFERWSDEESSIRTELLPTSVPFICNRTVADSNQYSNLPSTIFIYFSIHSPTQVHKQDIEEMASNASLASGAIQRNTYQHIFTMNYKLKSHLYNQFCIM